MVKVILLVLLGIFILGFSYYLKEFKKLLKEIEEQMRQGLTEKEINTVNTLLKQIYNNLDKSDI